MELYNWGILLFLVLPAPLFLGLIPVKYMNASQRTPAMAYACGWFVSFFLFELTAIPFLSCCKKSFSYARSDLYSSFRRSNRVFRVKR